MLNHKLDHFCKVNINGYSTHIGEHCLPNNIFFFQAEDGIRDDLATGVQTCALPISVSTARNEDVPTPPACAGSAMPGDIDPSTTAAAAAAAQRQDIGTPFTRFFVVRTCTWRPRSEERRVGKEGRCEM